MSFWDQLIGGPNAQKNRADAEKRGQDIFAQQNRDEQTGQVNEAYTTAGTNMANARTDIGAGYTGARTAQDSARTNVLGALDQGYTDAMGSYDRLFDTARTDLTQGYGAAHDTLFDQYGIAGSELSAGYGLAQDKASLGYDQARSNLDNGYDDAIRYAQVYGDKALDQMAPYLGSGARAQTQLDLYNTGGPGGAQAQEAAYAALNAQLAARNQDAINNARKAQLQRANAGGGGIAGGRQMKADAYTTSNIMNQYTQQEIANLRDQAARGQAAGATAAGIQSHTGDQITQAAAARGQELARLGMSNAQIQARLAQEFGTASAGLHTALGNADAGLQTARANQFGALDMNMAASQAALQRGRGQDIAGAEQVYGNNVSNLETGQGNAFGQLDQVQAQQAIQRGQSLQGITNDYYGNRAKALSNATAAYNAQDGKLMNAITQYGGLALQAFSPVPLPRMQTGTNQFGVPQYGQQQYSSPASNMWDSIKSGGNGLLNLGGYGTGTGTGSPTPGYGGYGGSYSPFDSYSPGAGYDTVGIDYGNGGGYGGAQMPNWNDNGYAF